MVASARKASLWLGLIRLWRTMAERLAVSAEG